MTKGASPFFSSLMNITIPHCTTPGASLLIEHMLAANDAYGLRQPFVFDVYAHPVLFTIKNLLETAATQQHKVFIAGDYDADGLCATAMMVTLCQAMHLTTGYYIPHRTHEGYGLKPHIAQQALDKGYEVFICVDNGVSAFEAIALLQAHHKVVIIIDHHTITQPLHVDALLHPQTLKDNHVALCTSGLVYCLAQVCQQDSDFMLQCAGVATIADMMPLVHVNRDIVIKALNSMNKAMITPFALLLKKNTVNEEDVGFHLIPKINAIGRMSELANANTMVAYLCSQDRMRMEAYAQHVETINNKRKALTKQMASEALENVPKDSPFVFVVSKQFHEGIVGLIANQLMRQLNTNVFVGVEKEHVIKGSMRSKNIHLMEALQPTSHMLTHFGGHAKAAGCEIRKEDFDAFVAHMLTSATLLPPYEEVNHVLRLDPMLITGEAMQELEACRPFGVGWERAVVLLEAMIVVAITPLKNGYTKGVLAYQSLKLDVFALDEAFAQCKINDCISAQGTLGLHSYQGIKKIQFTLTSLIACQASSN